MAENNPRARARYERLGYVAYGSAPESWDEDGPDGSVVRYEAVCALMREELGWLLGSTGGEWPGQEWGHGVA